MRYVPAARPSNTARPRSLLVVRWFGPLSVIFTSPIGTPDGFVTLTAKVTPPPVPAPRRWASSGTFDPSSKRTAATNVVRMSSPGALDMSTNRASAGAVDSTHGFSSRIARHRAARVRHGQALSQGGLARDG